MEAAVGLGAVGINGGYRIEDGSVFMFIGRTRWLPVNFLIELIRNLPLQSANETKLKPLI